MKYKVGDQVVVKVEHQKDGYKRVLTKEPAEGSKVTEKAFVIASIHPRDELYSIIIDDDMTGWWMSEWHVKYNHVDKKYVGKKFYDINDSLIIRKK